MQYTPTLLTDMSDPLLCVWLRGTPKRSGAVVDLEDMNCSLIPDDDNADDIAGERTMEMYHINMLYIQ